MAAEVVAHGRLLAVGESPSRSSLVFNADTPAYTIGTFFFSPSDLSADLSAICLQAALDGRRFDLSVGTCWSWRQDWRASATRSYRLVVPAGNPL